MDSILKCLSFLALAGGFILYVQLVVPAEGCNEAVCASVVSKCMLTQSCKCDLKNCSCCKDCFSCLGHLYSECCSCVDMCPKPNDTMSELSKKSHVEDFTPSFPELFKALTMEPDPEERWHSFTFPVDYNIAIYRSKYEKEIKYTLYTAEQEVDPSKDVITLNCTVAYMSQCMSWKKCRESCQSTGAASYRWFHDGCCECVGDTCINYGINESRCVECPVSKLKSDYAEEEDDESAYTYDYEDDYGHEKAEEKKTEAATDEVNENEMDAKESATA